MAERAPLQIVPNVVGLELGDAIRLVEGSGFARPTWKYVESFQSPGTVIGTEPLPETMVRTDKPVVLQVCQQSLIRFLPTVFQEGRTEDEADLLSRFLWIANHFYDSVQMGADKMTRQLSPFLVEEDYLPWLASWVGLTLDEGWSAEKKRSFLARSARLFTVRGTAQCLTEMLEAFTGVTPAIEENVWPYDGFRIGVTSSIGEDSMIFPEVNLAFCFVVRLPKRAEDLTPEMCAKIHQIIRQEKPAHTMYFLQYAGEAGLNVDQTMMSIGIGTRIGLDSPEGTSE